MVRDFLPEVSQSVHKRQLSLQSVMQTTLALCLFSVCVAADANTSNASRSVNPAQTPLVTDTESDPKTPTGLIEAMSEAMQTLNYEGTFVHAQGTTLTSMHILHASTLTDGEYERLSALDGEDRQVFRNNSLVVCIWPDSQELVLTKSKPRDVLPQVESLARDQRYSFSLIGPGRVAGRDTLIVNAMPRDEFGYGYRFWIDTETKMLLRSMLLDGPGNPVEQVIFTDISFPDTIDLAQFDFAGASEHRQVPDWLKEEKNTALSELAEQKPTQTDIVGFQSLPEGYNKISETLSTASNKGISTRHVMLTDGMASVSVYIEYIEASDQSPSQLGLSRMGAINAFGVSMPSALVTAVGDVPSATVRAIAGAVLLEE